MVAFTGCPAHNPGDVPAVLRGHRPCARRRTRPVCPWPACGRRRRTSPIAICSTVRGARSARRIPRPRTTLVELKHTGVNPGMTVRDPQGREWSVKQPAPAAERREGPVEVVVSRCCRRLATTSRRCITCRHSRSKDDWGRHVEPGGRFRLKVKSLKDRGTWSLAAESVRRHRALSRACWSC